jgi:hypothetical protein
MKLTRYQKQALGIKKEAELEDYILNPRLVGLYEGIDETN